VRRIPLDLAQVKIAEAIYASLPKIACKKLCHEACGPIFMGRTEWQRIKNRLGREPKAGLGEPCPMLTPKKECRVYDIRPYICRLYGLVEKLKCPFGCEPGRWMTDEEANAHIAELID
jgi:uncharacterized protein